ncbi:MAG: hypothetical protein AAF125_14355, partial [Chloroflexota bacterium]
MTLLLVAWALTSALILIPGIIVAEPRYLIGAFPAVCLVIGIGGETALNWAGRIRGFRPIVGMLIVLLVGLKVVVWHAMVDYGERFSINPGYLVTIDSWERLVNTLPQTHNIVLTTEARTVHGDVHALLWSTLLIDRFDCLRVANEHTVIHPPLPYSVLVPPQPQQAPNAVYTSGNSLELIQRRGDPPYALYPVWSSLEYEWARLPEAIPFENEMKLFGGRLVDERLWLRWELPRVSDPYAENYAVFTRMFDGEGGLLMQRVQRLPATRTWCGDPIALDVGAIPAGTREIVIAMLRRPVDVEQPLYVPVTDSDGFP